MYLYIYVYIIYIYIYISASNRFGTCIWLFTYKQEARDPSRFIVFII